MEYVMDQEKLDRYILARLPAKEPHFGWNWIDCKVQYFAFMLRG